MCDYVELELFCFYFSKSQWRPLRFILVPATKSPLVKIKVQDKKIQNLTLIQFNKIRSTCKWYLQSLTKQTLWLCLSLRLCMCVNPVSVLIDARCRFGFMQKCVEKQTHTTESLLSCDGVGLVMLQRWLHSITRAGFCACEKWHHNTEWCEAKPRVGLDIYTADVGLRGGLLLEKTDGLPCLQKHKKGSKVHRVKPNQRAAVELAGGPTRPQSKKVKSNLLLWQNLHNLRRGGEVCLLPQFGQHLLWCWSNPLRIPDKQYNPSTSVVAHLILYTLALFLPQWLDIGWWKQMWVKMGELGKQGDIPLVKPRWGTRSCLLM